MNVFFPRPSCEARGCGQGATVLQVLQVLLQDTSKNWRGFVDKNEARLAKGRSLLYSEDVYSGTDDLATNC